jgi:phospholipid/cholesterol/gamma-HCH transport system permease protein
MLLHSGQSLRRIHLTIRELYFSGVLSLLIILVSGCSSAGARPAGLRHPAALRLGRCAGVMVALSLLRELGPVVAALLFASRAGSAITAEIGLMKTTEQLKAMDMMAVNPIARVVAPRFWGGVISMPLLAALFSAMGIFGGWLIGVVLIGVDDGAFWSQMQAAVDFRYDVMNGVIKSVVFGVVVSLIAVFEGLRLPADRRRRVARDHPHRRDLGAGHPGAGFRADLFHVQGLMMSRTALDLWVGVFVAIGFAALLFLALKVGNSRVGRQRDYTPQRPFDNIGGLKVRAPVKSAGVLVGRVAAIRFDPNLPRGGRARDRQALYKFPPTPSQHPDLGPARRAVHRASRRGRRRDAGR